MDFKLGRVFVAAVRCGALLPLMTAAVGCAFGDRNVTIDYKPVMGIKAYSPVPVEMRPFQAYATDDDREKVGQVRNGYGMATAKVLSKDGGAPEWVRRALSDELANAGFTVSRPAAGQQPAGASGRAGVTVDGTVNEFMTDMQMEGYQTRIRVRLVVKRYGVTRLDKEFYADDGGAGITGSADEYQSAIKSGLTKLMRRAVPEVIAAIQG